jgi:hypothetical protein
MAPSVLLKALVVWLAILVLAVVNGVLRERALNPIMGPVGGLIASGAILSLCILLVAFFSAGWLGAAEASGFWLIGLLWLLLTLVFEFGFGRFVQRRTSTELLQAYTFKGGNIWPVVLAVTLVSPWLAARLRGLV